MKKSIIVLTLMFFVSLQAILPRSSNAFICATTSGTSFSDSSLYIPTCGLSLVAFVGGLAYLGSVLTGHQPPNTPLFITALNGFFIGGITLDSNENPILFLPLSPSDPSLSGLTDQQINHYNQELSQLNALSETVFTEYQQNHDSLALSDNWKQNLKLLSDDTLEVLHQTFNFSK